MREMQTKLTVRCHFTPCHTRKWLESKRQTMTSVVQNGEKSEPSYIADRGQKRGCGHSRK